MNNLGVWCAFAAFGVFMGKEFLDWAWWYYWEDNQDEENPAPLLCGTWGVWCKIQDAYICLWSRFWQPLRRRLTEIWWRFFPPDRYTEPVDLDGRTPTELLLIAVVGVWEMENWYKDEYDWEVKRKWDEFLKTRTTAEHSGSE